MNNNNRQTLAKAASYKNNSDLKKAADKTVDKKPEDKAKSQILEIKKPFPSFTQESAYTLSADRLQEAVIWAEILDKPLSRRRKRR